MFRRRQPTHDAPHGPGPALRQQALALDPIDVGATREGSGPVFGVVMDTTRTSGDWYCLVGLLDGTTSLYTSGEFGIIGGGAHEAVRAATSALLTTAAESLGLLSRTASTELPPPGHVVIRVLTFDGPLAVSALEEDLGHGRHAASPLFRAAHDVISELRLLTEGR